jgi:hypothetical protein
MARLRCVATVVVAYCAVANGNNALRKHDPPGRALQTAVQLRGGGLGGRASLFNALRHGSSERQSPSKSEHDTSHASRRSVNRSRPSDAADTVSDGTGSAESSTAASTGPDVTMEDLERAFAKLSPAALDDIVCSATHNSRAAFQELPPSQRAQLARGFKPWRDYFNEDKYAELRADALKAMQAAEARAASEGKTATAQQSDDSNNTKDTSDADSPAAAVAKAQRAALRRRLEAAAARESQGQERMQQRKQQQQQQQQSAGQTDQLQVEMRLLNSSDGRNKFLQDVLQHYILLFGVKLPTLLLEASIAALGTGVRVTLPKSKCYTYTTFLQGYVY